SGAPDAQESLLAGLHGRRDAGSDGAAAIEANIHSLPITPRFARPTWLLLYEPRAEAAEIAPTLSGQVALALDRLFLQQQTCDLQDQAEQRIREVSTIYDIGRAIDSVELGRL